MSRQQRITQSILKSGLLKRDDRVLVAVSGGPDSVALLHILYELREELALHLEVAHLEHGIRGQEAQVDARFVRELAEGMKLPVLIKEVNVPRLRSEAGRGNLEELARRERYRFFAVVARRHNLNKIATAHTQDDQAETVLMWLLRGAGLKGLGGMAPTQAVNLAGAESSNGLTIIRPFLDVTKEESLRFLDERGLEYRLDRSNEDTAYQRNWIRFELLPRLKERIDRGVPSRLAQMAEVLRDEETLLNMLAQRKLEELGDNSGLRRDGFLRQPKAMQRRLLRLWIAQARGHLHGLDFDHIEMLLRLISTGPPQGRLSIPGGLELTREYETLRLVKAARESRPRCYEYPMVLDGVLAVREAGMMIDCRRISSPLAELPKDHWEAVFDCAALTEPLVVRNFRRGDRFRPLGMAGHKKVKDLFIEKKAPLPARALLPLLVMGAEVLWLPGFGRSEIGRVGPGAKDILRIRVIGNAQ
ncbi:MAG TPA: tRNA lysidine(34) synthetase TilS [Candidatus Binatia bacterium]|jgi:tRNA(Ile)-lysidine synthase